MICRPVSWWPLGLDAATAQRAEHTSIHLSDDRLGHQSPCDPPALQDVFFRLDYVRVSARDLLM